MINREFFKNSTLEVAKELLGKILIFQSYQGVIIETEAYIGMDDAACHAKAGVTPRTKVMFGKAGYSYVYLIYGMYYCLNIVTEEEGFPAAVLIRGIKLLTHDKIILDGPGKLCKKLGINKTHNEIDLINNKNFTIEDNTQKASYIQTPRVGIKKAIEKPWRFVAKDIF